MEKLNLNDTNINIIDCHTHLGKYASLLVNPDYENIAFDVMQKLHFKKIIITHHGFFFNLEYGEKETLRIIKANKDFVYAYLLYNPHQIEKSVNIIKKYFCNKSGRNSNIVGIKMHPEDHLCSIEDQRYETLWKIAVEFEIPVLSHTWNPNVASKSQQFADALLFEKVVAKYPGLKIILGHAGAKDYYYFKVIKMLKRLRNKNIYVDIAGDIFYNKMIEHFVGEIGSGQILFGSDMPWCDPAYQIINVSSSNISMEDKGNIFFNNALKLFKF